MNRDQQARLKGAVARLGGALERVQPARQSRSNFAIARVSVPGKNLVLKIAVDAPEPRGRLRQEGEAMRNAAQRAGPCVAEVMAQYDDLGVLVLADVGAQSIGDRLEDTTIAPAAVSELARRAGAWAARFHDAGRQPDRPLWPKKRIAPLLDEIDPSAPGAGAMRGLAEHLLRDTDTLRAMPIRRAIVHSDMHPHNLVLSPQGAVVAVDILRSPVRSVMTDVSRFLIYAQWIRDDFANTEDRFWGLDLPLISGFLAGYGPADDPTFGFLHGCEILRHWRFQVRNGALNARRMRRVESLVNMAQNVPEARALNPPSLPIRR